MAEFYYDWGKVMREDDYDRYDKERGRRLGDQEEREMWLIEGR